MGASVGIAPRQTLRERVASKTTGIVMVCEAGPDGRYITRTEIHVVEEGPPHVKRLDPRDNT